MSTPGVFSTPEEYHEYTRGCSVHWRDTISTLEGYHKYTGEYHEYTRGFWYKWEKTTAKFPGFLFKHLLRLCSCISWPLEH